MKYYIAENNQHSGPFEPNELLQHGLTVNSLVWCEGMANWTLASNVPELMEVINSQSLKPTPIEAQVNVSNIPGQPYAQPQYYPDNMSNSQQMLDKTWYTESIIVTILATLCCCNPIGICSGIYSIIKANNAKNKAMAGDSIGSANEASSAKLWVIVTAVTIVVWILFLLFKVISKPSMFQQIKESVFGSLLGA